MAETSPPLPEAKRLWRNLLSVAFGKASRIPFKNLDVLPLHSKLGNWIQASHVIYEKYWDGTFLYLRLRRYDPYTLLQRHFKKDS